jgi:hypothetical protein
LLVGTVAELVLFDFRSQKEVGQFGSWCYHSYLLAGTVAEQALSG